MSRYVTNFEESLLVKMLVAEYIRTQLEEDKMGEQLTMLGKDDSPFKGSK